MGVKQGIVITSICLLQIILIGFLVVYIQQKELQVEINLNMSALEDDWKVFNPQPGLAYFYEPPAGTTLTMYHQHFPNSTSSINTFNNDSLHDLTNYAIEKSSSTFRIVTLGDSFTYGAYIDTKDNYTERLENKLNEACTAYESYEVLNLAMHGYDIRFSLERLKLRGLKYNPDLVTWLIRDDDFIFDQNTFERLTKENHSKAITAAVMNGGTSDDVVYGEVLKTAMSQMEAITRPEDIVQSSIDTLTQVRDIYSGALLLFSPPDTLPLYTNERFPALHDFLNRPDVHYANTIGNVTAPEYAIDPTDSHPNELGSERLANDLFEYVTLKGLVPCN